MKEKKNLYELLSKIEDKRRKQGTRHSLPVILLIAIMGIMNGAKSEALCQNTMCILSENFYGFS